MIRPLSIVNVFWDFHFFFFFFGLKKMLKNIFVILRVFCVLRCLIIYSSTNLLSMTFSFFGYLSKNLS
jgi:hypothetical protein